MKRIGTWSLKLRLSLFFAILLTVAWSVAAVWSWRESVEYIDEFFDTQQMLFAKRLASARYEPLSRHLPDTGDILSAAGRGDEGEQEDDALAFAVFRPDGTLILSDGEDGRDFVFSPNANGFVNTRIDGDMWRLVWLTSLDKRVVVAVGQELEYRDDMALEMLTGQMLPWLFLLPVLIIGLVWMLGRELAPLRSVASELGRRDPDDAIPIETGVQPEIRPLVQALNSLFARMGSMLQRERAFLANAAHELRTPLAGLSIQAQVAQSAKQPETRAHALAQLRKGIDRTSRLVDQLLTLSRLESLETEQARAERAGAPPVRWSELVETVLAEFQNEFEAGNITLTVRDDAGNAAIRGKRELLEVLLRNLVGNAVKYTPGDGTVEIAIGPRGFAVRNTSREIPPADAARLGERFFRPPGQAEPGSGLGLSIARRVAEMHALRLNITTEPGWFTVTVS